MKCAIVNIKCKTIDLLKNHIYSKKIVLRLANMNRKFYFFNY